MSPNPEFRHNFTEFRHKTVEIRHKRGFCSNECLPEQSYNTFISKMLIRIKFFKRHCYSLLIYLYICNSIVIINEYSFFLS